MGIESNETPEEILSAFLSLRQGKDFLLDLLDLIRFEETLRFGRYREIIKPHVTERSAKRMWERFKRHLRRSSIPFEEERDSDGGEVYFVFPSRAVEVVERRIDETLDEIRRRRFESLKRDEIQGRVHGGIGFKWVREDPILREMWIKWRAARRKKNVDEYRQELIRRRLASKKKEPTGGTGGVRRDET